ncbi:hypothetical protein BH24ACI3_BH24ACI3_04410 [soil metagenome]
MWITQMIADSGWKNKEHLAAFAETRKRRTEITIETRSVTIIRTGNSQADLVECIVCGIAVPVFSAVNASLVFRIEPDELALMAANGLVHSVDDTRLCGNSLAPFFKQEIRYIED